MTEHPIPTTINISGVTYSVTTGPDGKQKFAPCKKAALAKLPVNQQIAKRANEKKPKLASRAKAQQHQILSESASRQKRLTRA